MRRTPARCREANSEYRVGAMRCRSWPARPATTAAHTAVCRRLRDREAPRSGTAPPTRTPRSSEKCTADRGPNAARTARNRRTPASTRRLQIQEDSRAAPSSAAHEGVRRVDLLRHVLERGMANILAMHHVDHIFADVFRMIADALQRTHDPHDFERAPD